MRLEDVPDHVRCGPLEIMYVLVNFVGPGRRLLSSRGGITMERETGFEPATSTLARLHSTS